MFIIDPTKIERTLLPHSGDGGLFEKIQKHHSWLDGQMAGEGKIELENVRISNAEFSKGEARQGTGGIDLSFAVFRDCTILNCGIEECMLEQTHFIRCIFADSRIKPFDSNGAQFTDCKFFECDFGAGQFHNCSFEQSSIESCRAKNANFKYANFKKSILLSTRFDGANFQGALLQGTKGLFGDRSSYTVGVGDGEWAHYRESRDLISWAHLRSIAAFRMFGVSYLALIVIVFYAALMHGYNKYVAENPNGLSWLDPAPRVSSSYELAITLIAVFMLASGATMFELFCPAPVKESSEIRWTHDLGRSIVEYRSSSWTYRSMGWRNWAGFRYLCFVLYAFGGLWTFGYLAYRVSISIGYLIQ